MCTPFHSLQLSEDALLDIYKKMVTVGDIDEQLFKAHKMVGHCTPCLQYCGASFVPSHDLTLFRA